jgi:3-(3-hydroxy-phenyl)propionate hydroxylase
MQCDVVIVGAGPAGATLANLLAGYGVRIVLLDKESGVVEEPRAVGIDDEALRTLQGFGMAEPVLDNAVRNAPIRYYDSNRRLLAHVAPSARPYGWPRRNLFFQPNLESVLRKGLDRFENVRLMTSCEVTGLSDTGTRVELKAVHHGEPVEITARFAVGADGGKSFVRGALDIPLKGDTAPMKWLVVDVEHDTWDAPYSAVYTSPHRPSMTIPLPFGFRRFEFKILDDEDPEAMAEPDRVAELMKPFYPDSEVPPAVRRRIYWHHSRTAETFQKGRVFLVGDAAHLQPPFFGQGMNSGIRDVTNLAWKLGQVLVGKASPALLASYDAERRENARAMVEFATGVGRLYHPRNRLAEIARNFVFRTVQKIPGGRDYILQMKYKPVPQYQQGFLLAPPASSKTSMVGRAFPQPLVLTLSGERKLLDDVFGQDIAILGLATGLVEALSEESIAILHRAGARVVQSSVMPSYRREGGFDPAMRSQRPGLNIIDIYDFDGGLRDILLARPAVEFVVVRPDRYVAAAGALDEVNSIIARLFGNTLFTGSDFDQNI